MDSAHIRWLLAGLFILFLAIVTLSDLIGRRPSSRRKKTTEGFRSMRSRGAAERRDSWKAK